MSLDERRAPHRQLQRVLRGRLSAAREMVDGGPTDVLIGDYLAGLTMAILYKSRQRKPDLGDATTFLAQMEAELLA